MLENFLKIYKKLIITGITLLCTWIGYIIIIIDSDVSMLAIDIIENQEQINKELQYFQKISRLKYSLLILGFFVKLYRLTNFDI